MINASLKFRQGKHLRNKRSYHDTRREKNRNQDRNHFPRATTIKRQTSPYAASQPIWLGGDGLQTNVVLKTKKFLTHCRLRPQNYHQTAACRPEEREGLEERRSRKISVSNPFNR
jgi:hypothetical protein